MNLTLNVKNLIQCLEMHFLAETAKTAIELQSSFKCLSW